jgi:NAD(P)-dependent dehydrogenase (short-subunit alcohol dehydrogenase family)
MFEKVAMVTAGGSGMGAAARKLAEDGFRVAVLSSRARARLWLASWAASA